MKTKHLSTTSKNVNDVNFMKRLFSSFTKMKIQLTFEVVAMGTISFALRISWLKFEPKVSNFSHETKGLLPSSATISGSVYLLNVLSYTHDHKKRLYIVALVQ